MLKQHHLLTVLGIQEEPSQGRVALCIPPAMPTEVGALLSTVPTSGQERRGVCNLAAFISRRSVHSGFGSSSFSDNTWLKSHKTEHLSFSLE